jgi:hypothetical protein
LGGFNPLRSDIDILGVVADDNQLETEAVRELGDRLAQLTPPGRGLELSIVAASAAHTPAASWPFLLHVTTAPAKVVLGVDHRGGPDLAMHYAVVRAAGITVGGRPPSQIIGAIARDVVLRHLADELEWAEGQPSETYAVLNATRAGRYVHDGSIVSKVDGGRRALAAGGPATLLTRALEVQAGRVDDRGPTDAALHFVHSIRSQLLDATNQ